MRLYADRGVVLNSLKFSENQLIVHILTENHGRRSYITRTTGKGASRNLFQPICTIEFQAEIGKGELHKITQVAPSPSLTDIPHNIVKSTIAMFLAEVLYRIIKDDSADPRIFGFVHSSIVTLDLIPDSVANFHLHFMVRLTHYLGFAPQGRYTAGAWFDIKIGSFVDREPAHTMRFATNEARLLATLLDSSIENLSSISLSRDDRGRFLDSLVDYYGFHTDSIHAVNSIAIFREIF